ncbi:MAG TPA: tRNA uridine-5-carboxymethylaminomethyl(34) synthesis GTPase MnmE, partial [Flavobacteriales bacterium]|nr:tRNA uridine-5-carboxymethylaminomethyl(34) synthesis GTPase MnmE [Flavobacteriales bacterium]
SEVLHISARTGAGIEALKQAFITHVGAMRGGSTGIVVTNVRHVEALSKAKEALIAARKGIDDGISGEFLASDLRNAQHHLGEITGRITPDDILGSIFGKFCIGK